MTGRAAHKNVLIAYFGEGSFTAWPLQLRSRSAADGTPALGMSCRHGLSYVSYRSRLSYVSYDAVKASRG